MEPDTASTTALVDKRPKRMPKKPDRYGKRVSAINRNAFFEEFVSDDSQERSNKNTPDDIIASLNSSLTDSVSISDSTQSVLNSSNDSEHILHKSGDDLEQNSPQSSIGYNTFQSTVIAKLDEILKRISYLEKDSCKTQARLNKLERTFERYFERLNGGGVDVMEEVSEADRETFGVPVSSKIALDKFEMDLTSSDFKSKLVIFVVSYKIDEMYHEKPHIYLNLNILC